MIGADTSSVNVIRASICTCWTSFVVRVISEGAPKWPTSRAEKDCTRSKTAARMSRPTRRRRTGAVVDGPDVADDLDQRDRDHHAAEGQDVARVALHDTVVNDVRVERGQVERGAGLQELQQHQQGDGFLVRTEVRTKQSYEHAGSLGVDGRAGGGCTTPYRRTLHPCYLNRLTQVQAKNRPGLGPWTYSASAARRRPSPERPRMRLLPYGHVLLSYGLSHGQFLAGLQHLRDRALPGGRRPRVERALRDAERPGRLPGRAERRVVRGLRHHDLHPEQRGRRGLYGGQLGGLSQQEDPPYVDAPRRAARPARPRARTACPRTRPAPDARAASTPAAARPACPPCAAGSASARPPDTAASPARGSPASTSSPGRTGSPGRTARAVRRRRAGPVRH